MKKVLITGGSGLVGSKITDLLLEKNYAVAHLSTRKSYKRKGVESYYWNTKKQYVDPKAFEDVSHIIHLAGAGIADERWTVRRKKILIESRVATSQLLLNFLKENQHSVKKFIGASAIGYYGNQTKVLKESDESGTDFLAQVCEVWEDSYELEELAIPKVVIRIGIVLAKEGGALPEMTKTLPFFVGILGSGKQIYSWIHLDDLAKMFVYSVENEVLEGVYNGVAPNPRSQKDMAKLIANQKGVFAIPAPKFGLQLALGEMSTVLFLSQNCSAERILSKGFEFKFNTLESAIDDLMSS